MKKLNTYMGIVLSVLLVFAFILGFIVIQKKLPSTASLEKQESPASVSVPEESNKENSSDENPGTSSDSFLPENSDEKGSSEENPGSTSDSSFPWTDPVTVAKRSDRSEAMTFHDFYLAGITCQVVYEPHDTYSYGEVISVEFTGTEDESNYYVQDQAPVILHVSSAQGEEADPYNDKIIYLTFDDGPSSHTSELLDTLTSYNIKATFFTVGTCVKNYPGQVRAIYDAGHALACHSYSHRYAEFYSSPENMEADIHRWEAAVSSAIGQDLPYRLYRYPGGSTAHALSREMLPLIKEKIAAMGYYSYDWTCANCDKWLTPKKEEQTEREYYEAQVESTITSIERYHPQRPRIMLLHETVEETRNMVPWIIEYLSAKGYTFRTLTRLQESYYF